MANSYFQFKQFIVRQDLAAMKVGTDGVLLGAWSDVVNVQSILDIGTGTGLVALMLAQRNGEARIDAIDLDEGACKQAGANFKGSDWEERLCVIHTGLLKFAGERDDKYDLVVSNPPFFNNSYNNDCDKKTLARHTDSLSYADLLKGTASLLKNEGLFCVVLPASEERMFVLLAAKSKLFLNSILRLRPTPNKEVKRVLMEFSFTQKKVDEQLMIVEEFGRHRYSESYKELTKDFYLAF